MVFGLGILGLDIFAAVGGGDLIGKIEYWTELCPPKTTWLLLPADAVNITRCIENAN